MDVYLDSCIAIYLLESHVLYASVIQERLLQGAPKTILWSELTRLESRVHPLRANNLQRLRQYDHFFCGPPNAES